jgi:chemotaxis protein MotB
MVVRKHQDRPRASSPPAGGWQIVYTGFVLILLCFFILLTSFASLEESKITRFVQAFSSAVSVFGGGRSLEKGKTMIHAGAMLVDKEDAIADLFNKVRNMRQKSDLQHVAIQQDSRGVIMTLADKLLFSSGQADLSLKASPLLIKVARIINAIDTPVEIEGHTDNVPINTPQYASNWELSTARAINVLRFITDDGNVNPDMVSAVGRAEYRPVVSNDTEANRAQNRRVEIIFKAN